MRAFFKRDREDVEPFGITVDRAPRREDVRKLEEGLDGHAVAQAGITPPKDVAIYLRDEGGHIVGGLAGVEWGGNFHIRLLWVHEDYRGEGYGARLVAAAEQEALARGCRRITVSTFSYQAPAFYPQLGFEEYAILDEMPAGHRKHYFRKLLEDAPARAERVQES